MTDEQIEAAAWEWIDEQRRPPDMALNMAQNLAVALYERHYKNSAPDWRVAEDMIGVLLQIDNMTSGLVPDDRIKEIENRRMPHRVVDGHDPRGAGEGQ